MSQTRHPPRYAPRSIPSHITDTDLHGQVMINGHALSALLSFVAAIPAGPESRSKVSAPAKPGRTTLDGRRSFDEATAQDVPGGSLVLCGPAALSIREWMRPSWPPPYLRRPRELLDAGTDQGAEADGHRVEIGRPVSR